MTLSTTAKISNKGLWRQWPPFVTDGDGGHLLSHSRLLLGGQPRSAKCVQAGPSVSVLFYTHITGEIPITDMGINP